MVKKESAKNQLVECPAKRGVSKRAQIINKEVKRRNDMMKKKEREV